MRVSVSILLFGCFFFAHEAAGGLFGGGAPASNPLGSAGNTLQTANQLNQLNQATGGQGGNMAGQAIQAVPKCDCPVDHSCDNDQFSDMAGQVTNNGMFSGCKNAMMKNPLGGRRRRGLFGKNPSPVAKPNPLSSNPLQSASNPMSGLSNMNMVPGASTMQNSAFTNAIGGKLKKCDERNGPNGQFTKMAPQMDQIMSGKFSAPQMDAAQMCKDTMKTDQQQCQMLKRQTCAFLKGKVSDPKQMSCAFQDVMKTQGQVKAKNSGCDTAGKIFSNPGDAGNALQSGMPGIAQGVGTNMAADKLLG